MAIKVRLDGKNNSFLLQTVSGRPSDVETIRNAAAACWRTDIRQRCWVGCKVLDDDDVIPDGSTVDVDTRAVDPLVDKYELQDVMHERELLAKIALLAVEVAMHSDHPLTDSLLKAIREHREWQLDHFGYNDDRFDEVRDLLVAMHEDMESRSD